MTAKPNVVDPRKPTESAELFKAQRYPTLLNQQDEWLSWDGSSYQPIEDETVQSEVRKFLCDAKTKVMTKDGAKFVPCHPLGRDVREVCSALKHICHVPRDTMAPPTWLPGTPEAYAGLDPRNVISLRNGLLDISTRELYEQTPFFFTRTALAIDYDADAPKPDLWLKFLGEALKGREPLIKLTQEMIGYCITTDTSLHRVFFMFGRPRSGKGTILRVMTGLVGENNTCFPSIKTLAGRFGAVGLIGKSLAQVTDMTTDFKTNLSDAASLINGVSGEDGQTVERKGISDWNGTLGARFVLAGNTMPNFGNHTQAMSTRLLIVPFDVSFAGQEDRALKDKLLPELAGILNWALDGLAELRERGDFEEPEDSKTAKLRLLYASDPIHGFVEERCTLSGGVDKVVIYDAYRAYCVETNARCAPLNKFSEDLMTMYPTVATSKRPNPASSTKIPCFRGVRLADSIAAKVYRLDRSMIELGFPAGEALERDAKGWPVPLDAATRAAADFAA